MTAEEAAREIELAVDNRERLVELEAEVGTDPELIADREDLLGRIQRYLDDIDRWDSGAYV